MFVENLVKYTLRRAFGTDKRVSKQRVALIGSFGFK